MPAGIIIFITVAAALAFGLSWLSKHRKAPDEIDGDPAKRFSDSMRIMHRDQADSVDVEDTVEVTTPLTRQSLLAELRLHAAAAARRRGHIATTLLVVSLILFGLAVFNVVPFWSVLVPAGLLVAFLAVARSSVRIMQKRLDAQAERVLEGFGEEDTGVIDLGHDESLEISVDLSAPHHAGVLWDPIPVTAPTYVSKPLVPRTVRTIDLSAPIAISAPVVPTADHPDNDVEELYLEDSGRSTLYELHPRAAGE